ELSHFCVASHPLRVFGCARPSPQPQTASSQDSPSMRPGSATPPTDRPTVSVRVSAAAARRVRRGHPWVFASDISRVGREGAPGDTAVVYDHRNRAVGVGLYDPGSPIRVRMLGPPGTRPGAELEAERLDAALALR